MNKLKTALLILSAIVIVILIFFLVKNANNANKKVDNDKIVSEIKYMDNRLTSLLNSVNNISLENYKLSVTKTSTKNNSSSSSSGEQEQSNTAEQGNQESQEGQGESNEGENSSSSNINGNDSSTSTSNPEQYGLKGEGILTGDSKIDWETIKNEVEILYSIMPTITLDLYNANANREEILSFNKELDTLTTVIKEENKEDTLAKLANLYRYLPVYASDVSDDDEYTSLLEIKSNIFNSYVFANAGNWEETLNFVKKAIESYSNNLNNIDRNSNYNSDKIYIILNELQNAADISDLDIFLIKYKTFLEETEKSK